MKRKRPPPSETLSPAERIGKIVREARKAGGGSVRLLGSQAEVTGATISNIENGELVPSVDLLERLAKALDLDLEEMYGLRIEHELRGWHPNLRAALERRRAIGRKEARVLELYGKDPSFKDLADRLMGMPAQSNRAPM